MPQAGVAFRMVQVYQRGYDGKHVKEFGYVEVDDGGVIRTREVKAVDGKIVESRTECSPQSGDAADPLSTLIDDGEVDSEERDAKSTRSVGNANVAGTTKHKKREVGDAKSGVKEPARGRDLTGKDDKKSGKEPKRGKDDKKSGKEPKRGKDDKKSGKEPKRGKDGKNGEVDKDKEQKRAKERTQRQGTATGRD